MKVSVREKKGNSLTLIIDDSDPGFVNSLRRAIIAEVPSLAIEYVNMVENSSPVFDEIISHRLGLIPVPTDLSLYNFREECKCKGKGCPSCTLRFTLEKQGPGIVYSQDLKSEDSKIKVPKSIPISKLGKNQNIVLEAEAVLGRGRDHAKWQPAIAAYKYYPDIEIGPECSKCGECAEVCPTHVYSVEKGKLKIVDLEACILCNACVEACEAGDLKVRGREDKFVFKIESAGALEPKEIFNAACDILMNKAKELEALL